MNWVFPSTTSNTPLPVGITIHILLFISVSLSLNVTLGHNVPLYLVATSNFFVILLMNFFLTSSSNVNIGLYLNFLIFPLKDSMNLVVFLGHLVSAENVYLAYSCPSSSHSHSKTAFDPFFIASIACLKT